ncbi:sigma-54-dependent Fis family transcriptional regulator [Parathalassolituus penaei]|uniref:Sigma-54-dependent Fis family transcriptional regulator n=1 Tax=Parathalassolituus penaei TaxID=2997323 RepID=A0A9X3ITS3_9GAMM|nr:sigma-54-dependent Fis family transcriptional regulator [Parathalassolituus penaei]MCY0966189.1 sigma-54-dependent Fis family transcriptional regulator [Parathalassolituus penaei]
MWSALVESRNAATASYQQRLRQAREQFAEGGALPSGLLPDNVLRSWQRSRHSGLRPWQSRLASQRGLYPLAEAEQQLASITRPHLERLWPLLGGVGWSLFCVNRHGIILCSRSSGPHDPLSALQPGLRIQEQDIGTTAPMCTLADQQPLVLTGSQHYLSEFDDFFCTSVPLFAPDGELLGVLDLTGIGKRQPVRTLALLEQAALQIQAELFARLNGCQLLSVHTHQHDHEATEPVPALLALDDHGRLQAANSPARQLLALPDDYQQQRLSELFDSRDCQRLLELQPASAPLLARLPDGSALYIRSARTSKPGEARIAARSAALSAAQALSEKPLAVERQNPHPLGNDPHLNQQFELGCRAFAAGVPILLQGETGTGKEVFARALHQHWNAHAPFVAINCAAIPESLLEAELFGYADGAFTGGRKGGAAGRLEAAHGGTLLLDEIGDMPLAFQTRLLRVLQERSIRRLGSDISRPLDIRLVSASLRPLAQAVNQQQFREDLYYRLNGFTITLPALRQRQDFDELLLRLMADSGCELTADARQRLLQQDWPGNIRQLEQTLKLATALAGAGNPVELVHLPQLQNIAPLSPAAESNLTGVQDNRQQTPCEPTLEQATRQLIEATLAANQGNISRTARQLGCSRTTLYKKLGLASA